MTYVSTANINQTKPDEAVARALDRVVRMINVAKAIRVVNWYKQYPVDRVERASTPDHVVEFERQFGRGPGPASSVIEAWSEMVEGR